MSEYAQKPFYIYHSRLLDLLQEVRGRSPILSALLVRLRGGSPAVRVDSLSVHVGLLIVWGVLVTVRRGDEVHSAWVVADQATDPASNDRHVQGRSRASALFQRITTLVRDRHMQVLTGYFAVPEQAFRQVATLPLERPSSTKEEC